MHVASPFDSFVFDEDLTSPPWATRAAATAPVPQLPSTPLFSCRRRRRRGPGGVWWRGWMQARRRLPACCKGGWVATALMELLLVVAAIGKGGRRGLPPAGSGTARSGREESAAPRWLSPHQVSGAACGSTVDMTLRWFCLDERTR